MVYQVVIFIPVYNTVIFIDQTHLFVLHMFSKHDVVSHVIFNYNSEFLNFFYSLDTVLNMYLLFNSDYHLEDNKQTECTNQTPEQYLYIYYNYQHAIY